MKAMRCRASGGPARLRLDLSRAEERQRARLAEIDRELARLHYRHDIAMSAFRFEEATALGREIAALDGERQALANALPPPAPEPTDMVPTGTVPTLARPPRARRSRR